jgi:hypothetical protein
MTRIITLLLSKELIPYNFHFEIFDEEENLMFTTEPKLFLIRTITILKVAKLEQLVGFTSSINIKLVEQVLNAPIEPIFVLPIQIVIPHDTFMKHLQVNEFKIYVLLIRLS